MLFVNLVEKAGLLIKIIFKNNKPIDSLANQFFRDNKNIGSKERKFLSESVFSAVRIWNLCDFLYKILISKSFSFSNKSVYDQSKFQNIINNKETIAKYLISLIIFQHNILKINTYNPEHLLNNIYTKRTITFSEIISEFLMEFFGYDISEYNSIVEIIENEINLIKDSDDLTLISYYTSTPLWIIELMNEKYSPSEIRNIFLKCLEPANVCLRVNSLITNRESVMNLLKEVDGISTFYGSLSKDCLILETRAKADNTTLFKSGLYEFQDEGSQLISYALNPKQHWSILDSCAGAGGKSLHISVLQKNYGKITAIDLQLNKLKELAFRAKRCGINTININALKRFQDLSKLLGNRQFDAVLVDAPCSGMGIIRRDPMRKYRLNQKTLQKLTENQLDILTTYAKYVKTGGVVVYATCSLLPNENIMVAEKFLANNPNFRKDNLYNHFVENELNIPGLNSEDFDLSLLPSIHNTDGFYMARFVREY